MKNRNHKHPYKRPTATLLSLHTEGPLLADSLGIHNEVSNQESLSTRKGWDSEGWAADEEE